VLGARVHRNPGIQAKIANSDSDIFVIVGYIGLTNQIAMRTLTRLGKPWVFWGELPGFKKRGFVGDFIRRTLQSPLRHASAVVGIGGRASDVYKKLLMDQKSKCEMVYNIPYYTDLSAYTSLMARRCTDEVRLLYCGQLIERKGVDLLVRAFVELLDVGLKASLKLVGEGSLKRELQNLIPERHRQRILFTGFCQPKDLPGHFGEADLFVLPSRHDGWGVVVTQALAAGLPVLSTNSVGAAIEYVTDSQIGRLVSPSDYQQLKEAIRDAVHAQRNGELDSYRCRAAAERFQEQSSADAWFTVFSSTL
jgi:glycosyltransferase involved in cell wall biosynthesis